MFLYLFSRSAKHLHRYSVCHKTSRKLEAENLMTLKPQMSIKDSTWRDSKNQMILIIRIILCANYRSYTEALDLTGLQTLYNRCLQLCTKFAVDCTQSKRYSDWFPLNNKTHGTWPWGSLGPFRPSDPELCDKVHVGAQYHIFVIFWIIRVIL